ncbi:OmpA family protein [Actibacterium sp. MT2.3-13A]|uniref:OmpA family protein n=1 Tax=Actibacterium sp. MT2.3-13A TaxID=2828332 RepID=UPI001BA9049F|nr:OmpA family protein [Actibacterium sp. MT2.3-13A]
MRAPLVLVTAAAIAGLSACTDQGAGSDIDTGDFGNATMNNTLAMTSARDLAIDLSHRFAAEVPSTINFAFNSAELDGAARATLREQARWISQYPDLKFRVYGHTDKVGSDRYNKRLGLRRANVAVDYLVTQGIPRRQLEAVVSFGETQPLIVTEGRERQNRRTVTEVSGFLRRPASLLDGKYALFTYSEYVTSATEPHELVLVDKQGGAEER